MNKEADTLTAVFKPGPDLHINVENLIGKSFSLPKTTSPSDLLKLIQSLLKTPSQNFKFTLNNKIIDRELGKFTESSFLLENKLLIIIHNISEKPNDPISGCNDPCTLLFL